MIGTKQVKASGTVRIIDKDGNVKSEFKVESIEINEAALNSAPAEATQPEDREHAAKHNAP